MFGFLKLKSCGLTPQEKLIYRSHFCSVCHAMTNFGGRVSSLLTNYDITFWLLLQSALDSKPATAIEKKPCTAVPFQKVSVRPLSSEVSQIMAALNLTLVGAKVEDDVADGEFLKPMAAKALFGKNIKKARAYLESLHFPLEQLTGLPQAQALAETAETATLESLSEPTANSLGEVFATIARLHSIPETEEAVREFGRNLGAYLYLWDALTDLEADLKNGSFNAISKVYDGDPRRAEIREFLSQKLKLLKEILDSLALGPEGKLCYQLLGSLNSRLCEKLPLPKTCSKHPLRSRLAKAGIVRTADCCECGDCCEVDCCECGSCVDCNCCDCNPCDSPGDHCCSLSCCGCDGCCSSGSSSCCDSDDNSSCCFFDCCCCCCCDNSGSRSRSSDCCDFYCLEDTCSNSSNRSRTTSVGSSHSLFSRAKQVLNAEDIKPSEQGSSQSRCPRCDLAMITLQVGTTEIDECRDCGGMWLDDKEIDELAKMPRLPHNLLNRYPSHVATAKHLPGDRPCPKCVGKVTLVSVPYLDVPIEMCRECHGFWVEHGMLRQVLKAKRSPRRHLKSHRQQWRCPYCEQISEGGSDVCGNCGGPRPKSGFTGKLA